VLLRPSAAKEASVPLVLTVYLRQSGDSAG